MSRHELYDVCCRYHGRVVRIEDRSGKVHFGKIVGVTDDSVMFRPLRKKSRMSGGFHYGGYRYDDDYERDYGPYGPYDYYYGPAIGFGFGFIFGIALAALFFF
ncbi:hypothetical protein [Bacillus sp. 165]|uniref:hypothetical protein n=1 Tax=Bacillus sp. 165 TaxID=1529117 RepID=UPI001ADA542D|nr:hypothetical protein [Bacillus sp. 165]MBO9129080.1 hypothetical protein [Bacillus sp. 165]